MERESKDYEREIRLQNGDLVRTDRIVKTLDKYMSHGKTEKLEIALSTREKKSKLLSLLKKKETGFCVFQEGKPKKYVSYPIIMRRLKREKRRYAKLSGGPHDRDEQYTYEEAWISDTLKAIKNGEPIERLIQGGESNEEYIKSKVLIQYGLDI